MTVNSFRDLRVWQAGMDLVETVYRLSESFPGKEMRRCAVSIPSNIAEGHTREHSKEYLHHISIAQASLAELQTQFEIAARLKYLSEEAFNDAIDQAVSLSRQLYALRNALVKRG